MFLLGPLPMCTARGYAESVASTDTTDSLEALLVWVGGVFGATDT